MQERSYRLKRYSRTGDSRFTPEGCHPHFVRSRRMLEDALHDGSTLEAICVMCDCTTMTLSVELPDGIRGIIEREEASLPLFGTEVKDIAIITRVGKPIQFKVIELKSDERGEIAILSRRAAQLECYREYISALTPGDIIPARITHLEPFGAFCDIGCGIVSLLTVDRISVSRISHPCDRFRAGDDIFVVVSSVEESGRIYLSHRELLGTWKENTEFFSQGQTVTGIVRSVEEYGVFIELAPNLAGLAELYDGAYPGDGCSVFIKSILPERMKIKLVLIDTFGEADIMPCKYFIDTSQTKHISRWKYSPDGAAKNIETVFESLPESKESLIREG